MKAALLMIVAVASFGSLTGQVQAQYAVTSDKSQLSIEDVLYDFQVYAAEQRTGWFIVWTLEDGSTRTSGPYLTEKSAEDMVVTYLLHGWQPKGTIDSEIVELPLAPEWVLFDTLPTRAEANDLAALLRSLGLLTDIRRVGGTQFNAGSLLTR